MKRIETRKDINASADELWTILMDFPSYETWNPMVVGISGKPEIGSRLQVTIAMKNGRRMTFRPTVVEYEEGRWFAWLGKVGVRGLFDGLHRFEIENNGPMAVFRHSEEFRGLLPPVFGRLLRDTHESMIAMDDALAQEVDRRRSRGVSPGTTTRVDSCSPVETP